MMFATVAGLLFFYISRYKQDNTYHSLCQCQLVIKKGKSLIMFATVAGLLFFYISRYKQDNTYHSLCQCQLVIKKGEILDNVCNSCTFVVFLHFKIQTG